MEFKTYWFTNAGNFEITQEKEKVGKWPLRKTWISITTFEVLGKDSIKVDSLRGWGDGFYRTSPMNVLTTFLSDRFFRKDFGILMTTFIQ